MTEILLRELTRSDIDWMATAGQRRIFAAGATVLEAEATDYDMYLILEGALALLLPGAEEMQELSVLSSGDILGSFFLFNSYSFPVTVQAKEASLLLAIPQSVMLDKLQKDEAFSARFFRAMALLLAHRQQEIIQRSPRSLVIQSLFEKGMLSTFSCLQDGDLCWFCSRGQVQRVEPGWRIPEGKPLDALYILLKGSLAMLVCNQQRQALSLAFGAVESTAADCVAELQPGEILGVTQMLGLGTNPYAIEATVDSLLLAVPLSQLNTQLQADPGFASRLYRALASVTADRTQRILLRLRTERISAPTMSQMRNESEALGVEVLQQMSVARAKFNWLLKQLDVKV
ncbi:MAG: cyclic nucleotide-binding domain-containing protein [Pegethrix bostrychoides GSE-TBD4-15B]|jgi:CRP-like cAMP-binding protein|uniref:Cyclic nucleotide-binding domain-containing protein n=1 Tax=Pegethrix bostrychoides GSE-TBD4-15B TaxID=2839662 RepID=A0A951PFT4_9CYAN|nr:cyclic nucleotide-binding domain-containing protein [Pegethrix bostrychoides GSE-TBD4-15B]